MYVRQFGLNSTFYPKIASHPHYITLQCKRETVFVKRASFFLSYKRDKLGCAIFPCKDCLLALDGEIRKKIGRVVRKQCSFSLQRIGNRHFWESERWIYLYTVSACISNYPSQDIILLWAGEMNQILCCDWLPVVLSLINTQKKKELGQYPAHLVLTLGQ